MIPVAEAGTFAHGDVLDVPGSPKVVHAPGHTPGACALLFEERGALVTGDTLNTLDVIHGGPAPGSAPSGRTARWRSRLSRGSTASRRASSCPVTASRSRGPPPRRWRSRERPRALTAWPAVRPRVPVPAALARRAGDGPRPPGPGPRARRLRRAGGAGGDRRRGPPLRPVARLRRGDRRVRVRREGRPRDRGGDRGRGGGRGPRPGRTQVVAGLGPVRAGLVAGGLALAVVELVVLPLAGAGLLGTGARTRSRSRCRSSSPRSPTG